MKRSGSGFTIVELLIVIVVIAILAAITLVGYNGITQRAQNAQLIAKVDAYTKAFQLYRSQNGAYPMVSATESGLENYACLGNSASFPASSPYSSGGCYAGTGYEVKTSSSLATLLKAISSNLPDASLPSVTTSDGITSIRGILYFTNTAGDSSGLQYVIKGNQDCARGTKYTNMAQWPGMTVCAVTLQ